MRSIIIHNTDIMSAKEEKELKQFLKKKNIEYTEEVSGTLRVMNKYGTIIAEISYADLERINVGGE